jgi:hypothetical protein
LPTGLWCKGAVLNGVCTDGEVIGAAKFDIEDMHSMVAQILEECRQSAWKLVVNLVVN